MLQTAYYGEESAVSRRHLKSADGLDLMNQTASLKCGIMSADSAASPHLSEAQIFQ